MTHVISGEWTVTLKPGNSCLVPACLRSVSLAPDGKSSLLKAYVPDLKTDIVAPLRKAGVSDDRIALLGGRTEMNHLCGLLAAPN
jgi:hypothetical protein